MPLYKYGLNNDFVMRASIPALLVLFTVGFKNILSKLARLPWPHKQVFVMLLAVFLLFASVNPLHEIMRSVDAIIAANGFPAPADDWGSFDNPPVGDMTEIREGFLIKDPENSLFSRILGR